MSVRLAAPARTGAALARIGAAIALLALGAAQADGGPPPAPASAGGQAATSPVDDPALAAVVAAHPVVGPTLAYRSVAREIAERALRDAEADLARVGSGLSASLTWRPGVAWRGAAGDPFDAAAGAWRGDLTASFGWRADAQVLMGARTAAHRALVAHVDRVNRDLREALSRHIDLRRAHVALTIAEDTAAARAATLATAERVDLDALAQAPEAHAPGAPEPRTLLASRLAAERAAADVERAARDVASAARRAAEAGFDPRLAEADHRDRLAPLRLEGWRLWLPAADPLTAPEVVRAALDLAAAEADAERVRVGGLLDDVRLEASRIEEDARLSASVGLDEGRPTADLDLSLRSAPRPSWTVELSAVLRIEDGFARELARAEAAVGDAAAAWAEAADAAEWRLAEARFAALDAEADVAFAERGLALARLALREAIDAWRGPDGEGPDRDGDPAAADRADAALARAAIALERERDAFYRAWNGYLLAAERHWSAGGVLGGVLAPP
jgi:hypothetical protein